MKRLMYSFWVLVMASAFVACGDDDKGKNLPVGKNDDFKIEVTELTTATIKATITPKNKDMKYVAQVEAINDIDLDWRINSV